MSKKNLILSIVISIFISSTLFVEAMAQDIRVTKTNSNSNFKGSELVQLIEREFASSVENILQQYIIELESEVASTKEEIEIYKITNLISTLEYLVENFNLYRRNSASPESEVLPWPPDSPHILSVTAVIAYFKASGYRLSAELLTHAFDNSVRWSTYVPTQANINQIRSTSIFFELMDGSTNKSGSNRFTKSNSSTDLFYSIHLFNYTVSGQGSYRTLKITDKYDYAYGDQSYPLIEGVAINAMASAQNAGVLVEYHLDFSITR